METISPTKSKIIPILFFTEKRKIILPISSLNRRILTRAPEQESTRKNSKQRYSDEETNPAEAPL